MSDQRKSLGPICDTHLHIFESRDRYPLLPELRSEPPAASLAMFLADAEAEGVHRMVFDQPSHYGFDNSCILDAIKTVGLNRARAIVCVDQNTVTDAELDEMHKRGARGVRVNYGYRETHADIPKKAIEHAQKLAPRMAERGWHLEFLVPKWSLKELIPVMAKLPCDFSVGHMGVFLAKDGVKQEGFDDFLRLHEKGKCWAKFTGVYRLSNDPAYADIAPLARAFIASNPDRIIWGSDWPYLSHLNRVTYPQLLELVESWAPDTVIRKKILVDNPAALFGF